MTILAVIPSWLKSTALKIGFKVQMTSIRSQKLWFGHVALHYDYYVTPSINSRSLMHRVTAFRPKALEVRIYLIYGVMMVKKKNKNWMKTSVCCFHLNQKHQFSVRRAAVYSSILYKADPDPDPNLLKKTTLDL